MAGFSVRFEGKKHQPRRKYKSMCLLVSDVQYCLKGFPTGYQKPYKIRPLLKKPRKKPSLPQSTSSTTGVENMQAVLMLPLEV